MSYEIIREAIRQPEYDFLRTNPHLGNHIILLGLGGSYAYGTNKEGSDIDIRGIYLPSREEILCGGSFGISEQVVDETTDTTVYALGKIVNLLLNVNPNTIELLGLDEDQYLFRSKEGQMLVENAKLFLSRKCAQSFGGYANSQLYRLTQKSAHSMSQEGLEKHILKTMEFMQTDFNRRYSTMSEDSIKLYIDTSKQEGMDTEIFMDISLHHYPLRDYCGMWNELKNVTSEYTKLGKRNQKALEHAKIGKHMMHLVRLYRMCFDLLEKEQIITHRVEDHDMLMEIRNGKYITENNDVLPEFFEMVDAYEKRLQYALENTSLPAKPDYERIKELVMDINQSALQGKSSGFLDLFEKEGKNPD